MGDARPDDPDDDIRSMQELAETLRSMGQPQEAASIEEQVKTIIEHHRRLDNLHRISTAAACRPAQEAKVKEFEEVKVSR